MVTRKTLKCLSVLFWALMVSIRVISAATASSNDFYNNYPFIVVLDEGSEPQPLTDEQFFDASAIAVFPSGKASLSATHPLLRELESTVLPRINSDGLQVERIIFRGSTSPDGSTLQNKRLGEQRAKFIFNWLKQRLSCPVSDDQLVIDESADDYGTLCLLMKRVP